MKRTLVIISMSASMLVLFFLIRHQDNRFEAHADSSICDSVTDVSVGECEALVAIAQANSSSNLPFALGWPQAYGTDPIETVCDWAGVTCGFGHVDRLFLM